MTKPKGQHGGKRANAGKPKGRLNDATIAAAATKEELRALVRERVALHLGPMLEAQIQAAKGVQHFILRDPKSGKFERVTDPDKIVEALNAPMAEQGSTFYIHTKDPSTQAFTDLLNRAIDKPAEQEQAVKVDGKLEVFWRGAKVKKDE